MEMSMKGSGIYADSRAIKGLVCDNESCDFEGETDVYFDDWKNGSWTCEECETDNEYNPYQIGDDDSDYDYWRENS